MKRYLPSCRHLKTLASFGAMQIMQTLLPLVALPWLARKLGPDSFGLLMYFCLFPPIVAMFMDWGLAIDGARQAAWNRDCKPGLTALLRDVLSAKLLLTAAIIIIAFVLYPFLPYASQYELAYCYAFSAGMARGLNPVWFFQGSGRHIPEIAALDVTASLAALACVFLFINSPEDWPRYLFFLTIFKFAVYASIITWLWHIYRPIIRPGGGIKRIVASYPFFGSSFCQIICYNGTQIILGYFLSTNAMGIIAACVKMLRAFAGFIQPFTQTIFPEACILAKSNPQRGKKVLQASLGLTLICAITATIIIWQATPWLINIAMGNKYGQAKEILRLMLYAAPFMAINNVMATQILGAGQQEKLQFHIIGAAAIASLPLAAIMAINWGSSGAATLPAIIEAALSAAYLTAIWRKKLIRS